MTTFRLLGPVEVRRDAHTLDLGGRKQKAVLAVLALEAGRVVSSDRLIDVVWGDEHPPSAAASLQAYVSNLRRILRNPDRPIPIVRQAPGYRLDVPAAEIDVPVFRAEAAAAQTALDAQAWDDTVAHARRALERWRGPLLVEFADDEWVRVATGPLEELRSTCEHNLVVGLLGAGQVDAALARARQAVERDPVAERPAWLHAVALYRAGRTPDALAAVREHARRLDVELGLEPGTALRDLPGAMLRQDAALATWPVPAADTVRATVESTAVPDPAAASDLVGRAGELAVAAAALRDAHWVTLTGPAGIGKSRLAEELASGRPGTVVRAGCPDDEAVPAWWPVRQVLGALGRDADAVLAPPPGVDADAARFAVYDAVARVLSEAAAAEPLLVLIEDVHWADQATLRFLTHYCAISATTGPAPAVLLTVRDGVRGQGTGVHDVGRLLAAVARRPGSRQLAVPPLSTDEVAALAAQVSGAPLEPTEVKTLATRTGGNPFFVCEYARMPADERADGDIPAAVRSVLGRRLAALDPAVLAVVRAVAVLGDPLDLALLATVARIEREDLVDLLDDAVDQHVVVSSPTTGEYAFVHALLRDEVLAGLTPLRRQRLHLRAADALAPGEVVRRAGHLLAAHPLADTATVRDACRAAAQDAEEHWYWESAAQWWRHAIELTDRAADGAPVVDRDDLVVAQVAALARAGRGQTVLEVIDDALLDAIRRDRHDSAGRFASILLRTSGSWPWAVHGSDPAPLLTRLAGVESLVDDNPAAHVSVLAALAVGSCYDPDPDVADRLSRRAIDLAESLDDPAVLADALLGRALVFSGIAVRASESLDLLDRLAGLDHPLARVDEIISHGLQFLARLALGDARAAAEHAHFGALGSDLLRLATSRVQFRWAQATLTLLRGDDLGAAEAQFDRALGLHQQTELYESGVFGIAMLCLRWEQGRLSQDEFATVNPRAAPWAAAVCAVADGDSRAGELLAAELTRVEPTVWTTHGRLTMLAHAVADHGDARYADDLVARLTPLTHCLANFGQVGVVGPVALALARLHRLRGDDAAARTSLATATEVASAAQAHGALLRCRLVMAQLADGIADGIAGRAAELTAIADEADRRGMSGVARDARRLADARPARDTLDGVPGA